MKNYVIAICFYFIFNLANSENLGIVGKTYPITEPDLIDMIKAKAQGLIDSGKWAKIQEQTVARAKNQILNPPALKNITTAKVPLTTYYDPTFLLDHNIYDAQGRLIAKQGLYNPLTYKPFRSELIFIDGDNNKQVSWATNRFKTNNKKTKIILVAGKYIELAKKYKIWFYYDQNGKYTDKFGIKHVPAVAYQEGKKIRIDEIPLEVTQQ